MRKATRAKEGKQPLEDGNGKEADFAFLLPKWHDGEVDLRWHGQQMWGLLFHIGIGQGTLGDTES